VIQARHPPSRRATTGQAGEIQASDNTCPQGLSHSSEKAHLLAPTMEKSDKTARREERKSFMV
jgi:hypothetical protein